MNKIERSEWPNMKKCNDLLRLGCPNPPWLLGRGSGRLEQNTKFFRKSDMGGSPNNFNSTL